MSCYAPPHGSDVFTHGMAGGSVTDWTCAIRITPERYMGTQANNAEGYKNSSAVTRRQIQRRSPDRMVGMIDDNVHMQNNILLISKLRDLKKDFEFMPQRRPTGLGWKQRDPLPESENKIHLQIPAGKDAPKELIRQTHAGIGKNNSIQLLWLSINGVCDWQNWRLMPGFFLLKQNYRMTKLIPPQNSRAAYGLAMLAFGVLHFKSAHDAAMLASLPSYLPGDGSVWIYVTGSFYAGRSPS